MSTKESILKKIADYLALRDHSPKEIQEKLALKENYDPEDIAAALQTAKEKKWFLPEDELAERVAEGLAIKNKSPQYINNYLLEKGLPSIAISEDLETQAIERCLAKKFKDSKNLSPQDQQKALRLLASRGFKPELCYKVLDHSFESNFEID